jgi:diguanylate cyclase (GGDEF)-like protein
MSSTTQGRKHPERVYSLLLFAGAFVAVSMAVAMHGWLPPGHGSGTAVFFVAFALFTISMGFNHPRVGYVSFDRVAQVASILIVGPVAAAWLNGLASLLYPWHRLRHGRPVQEVLTASLHNSGLMSLMVLGIGLAYQQLGGPVPLSSLGVADLALLLLMLVAMQAVNELAMRVFIGLRDGGWPRDFDVFAFIVESGAGLGGILVAIIFNRMELAVVALLLAVLSLGMLTLTQLARLRAGLESIVAERTRSLRETTLELERLATHDPLTGLRNRRSADEYLLERIAEFERYGGEFAVALVDLDHFKRINDDFSHVDGDRVLEAVAARMAASARGTDLVARYGGEEFLLCFPATDAAAAAEACEKIRLDVAAMSWAGMPPSLRVTMSAGVAAMRPGLGRRGLLSEADQALREAKVGGRNRVVAAKTRHRKDLAT